MHRRDFHRCLTATALTGGLLGTAPPLSAQAAAGPGAEDQCCRSSTRISICGTCERQHVPWLDNAPDVLNRSYVSRDYVEATRGWHIVKAIYMEVDVAAERPHGRGGTDHSSCVAAASLRPWPP